MKQDRWHELQGEPHERDDVWTAQCICGALFEDKYRSGVMYLIEKHVEIANGE